MRWFQNSLHVVGSTDNRLAAWNLVWFSTANKKLNMKRLEEPLYESSAGAVKAHVMADGGVQSLKPDAKQLLQCVLYQRYLYKN